jgi:hypothetical protein
MPCSLSNPLIQEPAAGVLNRAACFVGRRIRGASTPEKVRIARRHSGYVPQQIVQRMQAKFVEGTVYFLIRRSDLEQRRFDRVVAVYQQT